MNHTVTQMMGMLTIVENTQKYSRVGEMAYIKEAVEQHIIGFLGASYDKGKNKLRSIIIDGKDLTDPNRGPVPNGEDLLRGKGRSSFSAPKHYTALYLYLWPGGSNFRGWKGIQRLPARHVQILWDWIGAGKNSQPLLNFSTNALEPAYIFALINLYRVEPKAEFLTMAEQIGDNLLQASQHADSGLFTLEDDFIPQNPVMDKPELQEGYKGKSIIEILQDHHKTTNLDPMELLALLSIYAAQTGPYNIMPGWIAGGLYLKG
ncbi:MAG: hypothetical protein QGI86_17175 [Candidatus Poribacteria bacterium]|nr:hypothetical protein [Candidatus Poribacteria bacterium]MDP6748018.1 hypothetical protein [Candidatus Poribacteria bacterium]MDP6995704.1 hypothetical protein [Candidatus Poribacteria bacterium]